MSNVKPRLLGISGSIRKASFNTAVLATLAEAVADRATLTLFPLNDVPLYNGDDDTQTPPAPVAALRQAIAEADGLVIAAPEYNYGLSGVLKNALDWVSRLPEAVFADKPTVVISASAGRTGGETAQFMTLACLTPFQARLVPGTAVLIAEAMNAFDADGRLKDETSRQLLAERMQRLRAELDRNLPGLQAGA
jgi:chromate reductase